MDKYLAKEIIKDNFEVTLGDMLKEKGLLPQVESRANHVNSQEVKPNNTSTRNRSRRRP